MKEIDAVNVMESKLEDLHAEKWIASDVSQVKTWQDGAREVFIVVKAPVKTNADVQHELKAVSAICEAEKIRLVRKPIARVSDDPEDRNLIIMLSALVKPKDLNVENIPTKSEPGDIEAVETSQAKIDEITDSIKQILDGVEEDKAAESDDDDGEEDTGLDTVEA